jgi:RNA polymerase sigma-70 factor, ECF subfamily
MDRYMLDTNKKSLLLQSRISRSDFSTEGLTDEKIELLLVSGLVRGDDEAYKKMFDQYYMDLCNFANHYLSSPDASRDIVQDVFVNIWSNRNQLEITHSLKAYLYQAVRNLSLNYLKKHSKEVELTPENQAKVDANMDTGQNASFEKLMARKIWEIAEDLPEKRKDVFILHRKHGLTYKEIAMVMEIKRKTVENQMARALKYIREKLSSR